MGILSSKWFMISLALVLLLVLLYIFGKKTVHHEITINSGPDLVWKVLTDTEDYEHWNPVMKLLRGELQERSQVVYQFKQDENTISEIPSTVKAITPAKLLNQVGGIPLILTYDHRYILEPEGEFTKVIIHEEYRGIGVNFWNPEPVQEAYGRLNRALKERVESLN